MIVRLYTGDDGQAHFEDLNVPASDTETIALKAGADMIFSKWRETVQDCREEAPQGASRG